MYTWSAGILEVLYVCTDITAYWLFAYKYWTASFVTNDQIVRTNANAIKEGSNSAVQGHTEDSIVEDEEAKVKDIEA